MSPARRWAYLGVTWGLCATLAANVAHALSRDTDARLAPVLAAMFWPVALFISFELLCRLTFRSAADYVSGAMVALVGLGAGWISFGHTSALLRSMGESREGAALGALAVDGLLVAASLALYRASQPSRPAVPSQPSRPAVPSQPSRPTVPSQPSRPTVPSQPSRPTVPSQPSRPTVPLHAAGTDPVRELSNQGMSTREVAEKLGLSKSTVARRLKTPAA